LPALISVDQDGSAMAAADLLKKHEISQLPVLGNRKVVGSINEVTLVKLLHDRADLRSTRIRDVMGRPMPEVDEQMDVSELYRLLLSGHSGIVITCAGEPCGFVTRSDLVEFWSKRLAGR
jgi:cystathionine beta-synthase